MFCSVQVTCCILFNVIILAFGVRTRALDCSDEVVEEFGFGARFKADIEELLNRAFPSHKPCKQFSAYLWKQLEIYCGLEKWELYNDSTRRRLGGSVMELLHYRAVKTDSFSANQSEGIFKHIENIFKLSTFEENIFEDEVPSFGCAGNVQRVLQVRQPFAIQLAGYLDGFNRSSCAVFVTKVKSTFSQLNGFTKSDWLVLSDEKKQKLVEAIFRVMYFGAGKKSSQLTTSAERSWSVLAHNELLLGDIFATVHGNQSLPTGKLAVVSVTGSASANQTSVRNKSSGGTWNMVLWLVLLFTVFTALFLGLRFLEVIPNIA